MTVYDLSLIHICLLSDSRWYNTSCVSFCVHSIGFTIYSFLLRRCTCRLRTVFMYAWLTSAYSIAINQTCLLHVLETCFYLHAYSTYLLKSAWKHSLCLLVGYGPVLLRVLTTVFTIGIASSCSSLNVLTITIYLFYFCNFVIYTFICIYMLT